MEASRTSNLTTAVIIACGSSKMPLLEAKLAAYARQTVPPDEVRVGVSPASAVSDDWRERLQSLAWPFALDLRLDSESRSLASCRNAACEDSSADLIVFSDVDHLPHPRRIEITKYFFTVYGLEFFLHATSSVDEAGRVGLVDGHSSADWLHIDEIPVAVPWDLNRSLHANPHAAVSKELSERLRWNESIDDATGTEYCRRAFETTARRLCANAPLSFAAARVTAAANEAVPPRRWLMPTVHSSATPLDSDRRLLEEVTSSRRRNVLTLGDVPTELVEVSPLTPSMERPKTVAGNEDEAPWYEQLTDAFLLDLQDAYIGDNVVFDRERHYSFGRWWLGSGFDDSKLYDNTRTVRHVDKAISVTAWGGEAFQLFILDTLPRLGTVFDLLASGQHEDLSIVSHWSDAPTAQWFWKTLGLEHRVVQKPINANEGLVIHADRVFYPNWAPNLGAYGLHPRGSLRPVQERLGVLDGPDPDLVVYCSRKNRTRSVSGLDSLLHGLDNVARDAGYELRVFDRSGGFAADRELFKRAKVIVGPHGGGLANMVFARPGTTVVEFLPIYRLFSTNQNPRAAYWGLSQAAAHDYWSVEPNNYDHNRPGMEVDPEEVVSIVAERLESAKRGTKPGRTRKRDRVLRFGDTGYRLPKTFDWTEDEAEATVETAVMFNEHILWQVDRPGRKIGWIRESPAIAVWMRVTPMILDDLKRITDAYECILTSDRSLCELHPKIQYHPAGANLPWPWIDEEDYKIFPKSKLCSMLASPKTMVEGHHIRLHYAERLKDQLDLFGGACGSPRVGGEGSHPDKSEGLLPYMFSVTMENCRTDLYYTEKLTDCFACGTIPVYWGSDTIGEIFDTNGIVTLGEDFHVSSLSEELYREMLPAARNNLEITRNLELAADGIYRKFIRS